MAENEAPERIWIDKDASGQWRPMWYFQPRVDSSTPYVRERADLAAPDAAQKAAEEIDNYYDGLVGFNIRVMAVREVKAIISRHFTSDAVRQARREDVLGENLRGVLYQATLSWIEAHPYLKSKLEQGDVGDLTARLAGALRAEGEKGDGHG